MPIRRIVTGQSLAGKSCFVSDSVAPRTTEFRHVPGFVTSLLWETSPESSLPTDAQDPTIKARSWLPASGGTKLLFITFPPDAVMASAGFDAAAAGAEYMQVIPGLAEKFETANPGMHTTDSIDYAMLVEGEIHLELDDGVTKKLELRDVVIQNGTRHAWRNKSERPATMLFVLVGAERPG